MASGVGGRRVGSVLDAVGAAARKRRKEESPSPRTVEDMKCRVGSQSEAGWEDPVFVAKRNSMCSASTTQSGLTGTH